MADIYTALAIMATISALVFYLTLRLTRHAPRSLCDLLALAIILCLVWYIRDMWDHMYLVRLLPFSSLIILGNWLPIAVSFLAALAVRRVPGKIWRKSLSVAGLMAIGAYALYQPVRGEPPECQDMWRDGVSIQTTPATCSAACAATLLKLYGIPATENEMAKLCLTRKGTHWQGLYRGLKLKTAGTRWDVEPFDCNLKQLERMHSPAILTVGLPDNPNYARRYVDEAGWRPGVSHSAVLFDISPSGEVKMGDPAVGLEEWTLEDLSILWHGVGMRLVQR